MTHKLKNIINVELKGLLNELFDPNGGSTYYASGLDPKVVKLFETFTDIDDFYQSTLGDKYWKEMSDVVPNYNSEDSYIAVDYIIEKMKAQYPDQKWDEMEKPMRKKILDGIT